MVIVFDLDDTLYEELTFVLSGFKSVAAYLSPLLSLKPEEIEWELKEELKLKRDQIFNRFLIKKGVHSAKLVKGCLSIYRGHIPDIHPYPEALACLKRLKGRHPLYIVTDGNKLVQRRKFLALDLSSFVKRCFFTYAHGLHRGKPSPYCFEKICRLEGVAPSKVVYVADNPHKDFVGIKPLGFHTVRLLRGPYRHTQLDEAHEAAITIRSLDELDEALLNHLEKDAS